MISGFSIFHLLPQNIDKKVLLILLFQIPSASIFLNQKTNTIKKIHNTVLVSSSWASHVENVMVM